ncbi:MAG: hypothetical protein IJK24_03545 [Oscillospiraceae bacterium]|nr:hypothetical protein [Oscillospiraceae bacterium]
MLAAALMIDLKHSRRYAPEARQQIQQYMIRAAETANKLFRHVMLRELCFNGGDEVQALFVSPVWAYLCLRLLRRLLFPLELHAGIGAGEWTTQIEDKNTFYQDGTAYHRAREAIELAKRDNDNTALLMFGESGDEVFPSNRAWNAMMNAGFCLTERNTAYQNELSLLLECMYPFFGNEEDFVEWGEECFEAWGKVVLLMQSPEAEAVFGMEKQEKRRRPFAEVKSELWNRRSVAEEPQIFYSQWGSRLRGLTLRAAMNEAGTKNRKDHYFAGNIETSLSKSRLSIYEEAHPRGAATAVALAAGLNRQTVDIALRSSNAYAERALALALTQELKQAWEEYCRDREKERTNR